ncbi:MAG TPA: delta-60 repeat domain-containing protein [Blastocatellia bacterium]|jgi:uncharacterized delta-60 repeat protein|nr:delta-60 repeat domain-containing protein [Blastocatellia bacterium]
MTSNHISAGAKRRRAYRIALVAALSTPIAFHPISSPVRAATGDLDPSFGSGGKVVTTLAGFDKIHALAVQNDGKIIAAGASGDKFAVARYNANGSLDSGFGDNGTLTTGFFDMAGFEQINALLLQPDGKIVAAGYTALPQIGFDFALVRYNSDGTADKSFGSLGKVTTDFFGFSFDEAAAYALAIQSDGKIIAAGGTSSPLFQLNQEFGLARYNEDGTLDLSFGNGGKVATSFFNNSDYNEGALAVVIQPDGKILAAGGAFEDFGVARFNSDGSLDTSFGDGGKVITRFSSDGTTIDQALAISLQADGRIVAAGRSTISVGHEVLAVARYNSDGSLDTGFGSGGKLTADFFPTGTGLLGDGLNSVVFQADGKIVAGGLSNPITTSDFGLARYNSDGTLDSTFGSGGKVTTDFGVSRFGGLRAAIYTLALQADGKVIAAGEDGSGDFALARYDVPVKIRLCIGVQRGTGHRGTRNERWRDGQHQPLWRIHRRGCRDTSGCIVDKSEV